MWNSCQRSNVPSPVIFARFAHILASNVWKIYIKMQSQSYESSQGLVKKLYYCTSFSNHVAPTCLFDFVDRREVHLKVYWRVVAKHSTSRSLIPQYLLSHINVSMVSFLKSLLLLFHFCVFLTQLITRACMEAGRRNKPSIGIKALLIFWSSGQRQ